MTRRSNPSASGRPTRKGSARRVPDKAYRVTCSGQTGCGSVTVYTSRRPITTSWCPSCGRKLRPQDEVEIPYGSAPGAGMRVTT